MSFREDGKRERKMSIKFYKVHGTEVRKAVDEETGKIVAILGNVGKLVEDEVLFDCPDYDYNKFVVIRDISKTKDDFDTLEINDFDTLEEAKAFVRSL